MLPLSLILLRILAQASQPPTFNITGAADTTMSVAAPAVPQKPPTPEELAAAERYPVFTVVFCLPGFIFYTHTSRAD
jgi:hypothetical protein